MCVCVCVMQCSGGWMDINVDWGDGKAIEKRWRRENKVERGIMRKSRAVVDTCVLLGAVAGLEKIYNMEETVAGGGMQKINI